MTAIPIKPPKMSIYDSVDFDIWARGITEQNKKDPTKIPYEHTYLRGLHNRASIAQLRMLISAQNPNCFTRITSAWVDRTPQAYFNYVNGKPANCEVGDILIVTRTRRSNSLSSRAVLLQAKTLYIPSSTLPTDPSTKNEIELFEKSPILELWASRQNRSISLGSYDIASNLVGAGVTKLDDQNHFRFLSICADPNNYGNFRPNSWPSSHSVLALRWPPKVPLSCHSFSLSEAILAMIGSAPSFGENCSPTALLPDWHRLVDKLLNYTISRVAKSAGGIRQISSVHYPIVAQFMTGGEVTKLVDIASLKYHSNNWKAQRMSRGLFYSTGFKYPACWSFRKPLDMSGFSGSRLFGLGVGDDWKHVEGSANGGIPPDIAATFDQDDGGTPMVLLIDSIDVSEQIDRND